MSAPLPSLDLIRAFRGVMEHGSLSAAARALRLSQPTVRRQIEMLERDLAVKLFTRASNGLTPTPSAVRLLPIAQAVGSQAEAFVRAATGDARALSGTVRLSASRVMAVHVVPQALAGLRDQASGITVELTATDAPDNLLRRAADIALRTFAPNQAALVVRKLPDVEIGAFAAPSLLARGVVTDIARTPFVSDDRNRLSDQAMTAAGLPLPRHVALRSDDPAAQIAAIVAGLGVGLCQSALAGRLGLVRVWPELSHRMPLYVAMHEDQRDIARIRCVFDHLVKVLPGLT
ncbi:LysR family transcriptional regulator [Sulfitobacter sabulilitoris]|uniref:LysR family transcriptional regulator n=1 Tax=Sulfitobacter sabulilitoris TaxID=2562655 RepID=A0A5S3PBA7_9RHOB|nr:LysR family transcriptional regulator [Sulfitobacter sabulilitoris]TMM50884.1 LysR family transcriptional regulator [Sulfitobacter sabulilitoris]